MTTGATLGALLLSGGGAQAGGYLVVGGSGPYKWTASPITLNYDIGPFSATVSNAQGRSMCSSAINRWTAAFIPTSSLSFTTGSDLATDHGNVTTGSAYNEGAPDGLNPIIFDQTGMITSSLFGGAEFVVVGFAGPYWTTPPSTITEGRAVLNGLFLDGAGSPGDLSQAVYEGVITHELGHMLNLDHAQLNNSFRMTGLTTYTPDYTGFPTMYPTVHADIQDTELDDDMWISNLYPSGAFASKTFITGVTRDNGGSLMNGVNIIARDATDPIRAISCVSGYNDASPTVSPDGIYLIPGLDAGTSWVLDFEAVRSTHVGGSRVGPVTPLVLPGPAEFLNEAGVEGTADSITRSTTFVTGVGGSTISGVDLRFNAASTPVGVTEIDPPGFTFPGEAFGLPMLAGATIDVTGSISSTEGGNVDFLGGDPVEDWYVFLPPAGIEINRITLVPDPAEDLDLYLVSWDATGGLLHVPAAALTIGAGVTETIEGYFDSTNFGTGAAAGRIYIGVSDFTPSTTGYTLSIETTMSDKDALVVAGVNLGQLNANTGTAVITGRGFKNTGGNPTVTIDHPDISSPSVSSFSSTALTVTYTKDPGFVPGPADIEVTNQTASGGYAGRLLNVSVVPVTLSGFSVE